MQNESASSLFNQLMPSTPQSNQRKQFRKPSQKQKSPFMKQHKQSIHEFSAMTQDEMTERNRENEDQFMKKKKSSNQQPNELTSASKIKRISSREQQILQERAEQDQRREYLASKVTPVLNKMLVKIVNEKPKKVLNYMIDFLKREEGQFQQKRFNTKAQNDTIQQDRNMEEVFDQTVAAKFLRFKK